MVSEELALRPEWRWREIAITLIEPQTSTHWVSDGPGSVTKARPPLCSGPRGFGWPGSCCAGPPLRVPSPSERASPRTRARVLLLAIPEAFHGLVIPKDIALPVVVGLAIRLGVVAHVPGRLRDGVDRTLHKLFGVRAIATGPD
jgi:hypothetical protein